MQITLKQGDTRHALRAKLRTAEGLPIDLTGANVRFRMVDRNGFLLVDRDAKYGADGITVFVFEDGETDTVGLHMAEYLVTYADGRVETFPHKGSIEIYVAQRIGGV